MQRQLTSTQIWNGLIQNMHGNIVGMEWCWWSGAGAQQCLQDEQVFATTRHGLVSLRWCIDRLGRRAQFRAQLCRSNIFWWSRQRCPHPRSSFFLFEILTMRSETLYTHLQHRSMMSLDQVLRQPLASSREFSNACEVDASTN